MHEEDYNRENERMKVYFSRGKQVGVRDAMLYGQFLEHFHRQIYGGVFDPGNPLSDEDGFRMDVLDALRKIQTPVIRWPGGCFVSAYHWQDGVGRTRRPVFDRAWRVEESNAFGTDEFIRLCRKVGCEPYICTNAGTGTPEEMAQWVEYCNLESEGCFAKQRIANGFAKPHRVKYWSVGNENYNDFEIGTRTAQEWPRFVRESCKQMQRVDPTVELSAAALADVQWNVGLLGEDSEYLQWISIHKYWDEIYHDNAYADYEGCMAYTKELDAPVRQVRGLLAAMGLEKRIRIAFDEWNLRGWYHPNIHMVKQGVRKEDYLYPRDENDDNTKYTMADTVFAACVLNMLNRNCDIVGMANYAPVVNTRGSIFTYQDGIVLRGPYHVFDLYANRMGDVVLDAWSEETAVCAVRAKDGSTVEIEALDILVTAFSDRPGLAVSIVNKDPVRAHEVCLHPLKPEENGVPLRCTVRTIAGTDINSCNDIGRTEICIEERELKFAESEIRFTAGPHSVNVLSVGR